MSAEIGYQLSSITPLLDSEESIHTSFHKISEIGYRYVQLQGVPKEVPNEVIVSALEESGLICVATQEDFPLGFGDDPESAIRRAKACGAHYLTCALIPKDVETLDDLTVFASVLSGIADNVREAGLVFAFHPISTDYRQMEGKMVFEHLMDRLPSHVRLTFCIAAAHTAGVNPALVFKRYGDKMDLVHFKDFGTQPDGTLHMMPLGQGDHEWGDLLKAANNVGAKYVFAEQEKWLSDPFDCAADSWNYLKSLQEQ